MVRAPATNVTHKSAMSIRSIPTIAAALDTGQTVTVGAGQSRVVATSIENIADPRGEAEPNTPSYLGQAQGIAAITQLHLSRYCSQAETAAGLCSVSQTPNADQRASSLFARTH